MLRAIALAAALSLWGCTKAVDVGPGLPCKAGDRECAFKAVRAHVAKRQAFWKDAFARPLAERIGPAPRELVEILALDNIAHGYPNQPRTVKPAPDFTDDVRRALEELPASVRRKLEPRLAGIYFIEDIGGTGYTDQINAADGSPAGGFIILDPLVLRSHTANSWATWRDGTPFKPGTAHRLEETLEDAAQDNRKNAIQYILLHELGHVLAIGGPFHPDWNIAPKDVKSTREFPFFELSWTIPAGESRYATRFDAAFPQRGNIAYYFGPKLAGNEMVAAYEALERTNFPTLYAATSPGDDFAEAFANYVHTELLKRPFEIRLYDGARLEKRYGPCWSQARCAEKRKILEDLLGTSGPAGAAAGAG
jgi:hypothetical protein